jgi:hypothetical protein
MTINPKYTYIDENGLEKSVDFKGRSLIPAGKTIKTSYQNLCQSRINALKPRQNTENGIILKVKNCDMNKKMNNMIDDVEVPISTTETKSLYEEIGIPELETLYYDEYNFNDGKYVGITEEGKQVYMNDLEKFYIAFTGGECFPNKCGVIVQNIPDIDDVQIGQYFSSKIGEVIFVEKRDDGVYIKFKKPEDRDKLLKNENFKFNDIVLTIKKWKINKFSEIPLKDFHNQELCTNKDSPWQKSYTGNANDNLFKMLGFILLFYGFANILSTLPSGYRFLKVANLLTLSFLVIYFQEKVVVKSTYLLSKTAIPFLIFFIIISIRLSWYSFSMMTIIGNPITAILTFGDNSSINDIIKGF